MNTSPRLLKKIRKHIRKNDILLCHSGYHMTDLYNEQSHYLRIAQLFRHVHHVQLAGQHLLFQRLGKLTGFAKDAQCGV